MSVATTNYGFIMPDRGSFDWDDEMNGNIGRIDLIMKDIQDIAAGACDTANSHASNHTDGTDQIQSAAVGTCGLMTAAQVDILAAAVLDDGSRPMAANLDLDGFKVINGAEPAGACDLVTKNYSDLKIPLTQKAAINGVATLDGAGKVPLAQLPPSCMEYKGTWDADSNTPTLADGVGTQGDIYITTVAGSQDLGSGVISFLVGDWAMYNGATWEKSINSNLVTSVAGRVGAVVLDSADISVDFLAGATYTTLQDRINILQGVGVISGGTVTVAGSTLIDVSSGEGICKTTNAEITTTEFISWGAENNLEVSAGINYIYIDYNSGTPQVLIETTGASFFDFDKIFLASVYKDGTNEVHINSLGSQITNFNSRVILKGSELNGFNLEVSQGTLIIGSSNLNITLTEGVMYAGLARQTSSAFNTGTGDTFKSWYNDGAWQSTAGETQVDNTQYNDYGTGLAELTANRYGVHWVYLDNSRDDLQVVYGVDNYTSVQAENAQPPANLPPFISDFCYLVGKIIIQKSASTMETFSPYEVTFVGSATINHNDMASIDGGEAAFRGHLTQAQHDSVAEGGRVKDYQHVVTVAKAGGASFTTIQGAIDSISDNSSSNRYVVLVYPGTYTEDIVMEEYVSVRGVDRSSVIIKTVGAGPVVDFPAVTPANDESDISNITILSETTVGGGSISELVDVNGGHHHVRDCILKLDTSAVDPAIHMINLNGTSLCEIYIDNCQIELDVTNAGGSDASNIVAIWAGTNVVADSIICIQKNRIAINSADSDSSVRMLGSNSPNGIEIQFCRNNCLLTATATSDNINLIRIEGGTNPTTAIASYNRLTIDGTGSTGAKTAIRAAADNSVYSSNNIISVSGGSGDDVAFDAATAVTSFVESDFDRVDAADADITVGTVDINAIVRNGTFSA